MAGGLNPKGIKGKNLILSTSKNEMVGETLNSSPSSSVTSEPKKFSLRGILGLGQTIDIEHQKNHLQSWGKEFLGSINHLQQEEQLLFDSRQKELQRNIEELRDEIHKLAKATDQLEAQVEKASLEPIPEPSLYQVNFLARIRNFIANFRQNINEASLWVEAFAAKKKKRNFFWNTVKNKKQGGEQYLFSEEHSAGRIG